MADKWDTQFYVECGVKGARRVNTHYYETADEAVERAKRWSESNGSGNYWAEAIRHQSDGVVDVFETIARFNLD